MAMQLGAAVVSGSDFSNNLSLTYTSLTAGRGLVVGFVYSTVSGQTITSVTATSESNLTLLGTASNNTTLGFATRLAYLGAMSTGGTKTITINWSADQSIWGFAQELYDDVTTGITLDGVANNQGNSANPTLSVTTGTNNSAIIGFLESADVGAAAGTGFTSIVSTGALNREVAQRNLNAGTAGAISTPWATASAQWTAAAAGFKAAGGSNTSITTGLGSQTLSGTQSVLGIGLFPGTMIAGT